MLLRNESHYCLHKRLQFFILFRVTNDILQMVVTIRHTLLLMISKVFRHPEVQTNRDLPSGFLLIAKTVVLKLSTHISRDFLSTTILFRRNIK